MRQGLLNDEHPRVVESVNNLARARIGLTNYAAAESLLVPHYILLKTRLGEQDEITLSILASIIDLYEAWGKQDEVQTYRQMHQ